MKNSKAHDVFYRNNCMIYEKMLNLMNFKMKNRNTVDYQSAFIQILKKSEVLLTYNIATTEYANNILTLISNYYNYENVGFYLQ